MRLSRRFCDLFRKWVQRLSSHYLVVSIKAHQAGSGFAQQEALGFIQPYLVVGIEAEQGGRQLGISVHNVVHLDIWREGADVVVLDTAQLQIKQSLQQQQGGCQ